MKNDSGFRVVLAGGGTGGHIIPAIAVADEVTRRGGWVRFVGTADRIEARLVPRAGYGIDFVRVRPLAGGGVGRKVTGLATAPISVIRCIALLRQHQPDVVLGVGGYVAGPVVLAARILGIPTAVLEQNATVGMANRILARFIRRAFVSYPGTIADFPAGRAEHTGNPVKQSILDAAEKGPISAPDSRIRILVMGGSQGASAIDERVPAALSSGRLAPLVTVTHQSKESALQSVQAAYDQAGIPASTTAFIDDTASTFRNTDLVIARSGATTVSELTVMGLPAVFLPYPHHADRQQEKNAAPMRDAGAAIIVDEKSATVADLESAISDFVCNRNRLENASEASKRLGRPLAARVIVDRLREMTGKG